MISIIVPFYNTEKYLEQCLASIKGQTFSNFECLMIDDGSTDSSTSIAQKYVDEDNRFVLLNDHHIGFPLAKNLGLDHAKGEYICFIDSDDFVDSHYLEYLHEGITKFNADICCCDYLTFSNNITMISGLNRFDVFKDNKMSKLFVPCSTFMWNKLFKREIFDDLRFDDVEALSDTMLCYKLFEKADSVSFIYKFLIYHRTHTESMTHYVRNFSSTYWKHRMNVYITMCNYLCEHYQKYSNIYKKIFIGEVRFCFLHLSKQQQEYFLNSEDAKKLGISNIKE